MADRGIIFAAPMVRALLDGRKTQTRRLLTPGTASFGSASPEFWEHGNFDSAFADNGFGAGGYLHVPCHDQQSCGRCEEMDWETTSHRLYPRARIGDRLYVREAWHVRGVYSDVVEVGYRASVTRGHAEYFKQIPVKLAVRGKGKWPEYPSYGPSIHMPRWASRLYLTVDDVRVQRLQDIGSNDAEAEGVERHALARGWKNYREDRCFVAAPETSFETLWDSLHDKPGTRWEDNPWLYALTFTVHHGNIDGAGNG